MFFNYQEIKVNIKTKDPKITDLCTEYWAATDRGFINKVTPPFIQKHGYNGINQLSKTVQENSEAIILFYCDECKKKNAITYNKRSDLTHDVDRMQRLDQIIEYVPDEIYSWPGSDNPFGHHICPKCIDIVFNKYKDTVMKTIGDWISNNWSLSYLNISDLVKIEFEDRNELLRLVDMKFYNYNNREYEESDSGFLRELALQLLAYYPMEEVRTSAFGPVYTTPALIKHLETGINDSAWRFKDFKFNSTDFNLEAQ